jgi:hypothetical protein
VDVAAFGPPIDPLLFSWSDLSSFCGSADGFPLLVVQTPSETLEPAFSASASRGPVDLLEVPDAVGMMMRLTKQQRRGDESTSDDDETAR